MNIPQIKLIQSKGQLMHNDDIIVLDPDSDFGNLTVKYFVILTRIAKVNLELEKLYKDFKNIDYYDENPIVYPKLNDCYDYHKVEQIIYDLRVSTDQLICLSYVLNYKRINGKYPKKIKIDCIGKYLKTQTEYLAEYGPFKNFLEKLNQVSNAYKHSFLNGQTMNLRGSFEPVLFALDLKYNDKSEKPVFYSIKLAGIIKEFDEMFQVLNNKLRENTIANIGNNK
jgi:hypothetical protein